MSENVCMAGLIDWFDLTVFTVGCRVCNACCGLPWYNLHSMSSSFIIHFFVTVDIIAPLSFCLCIVRVIAKYKISFDIIYIDVF